MLSTCYMRRDGRDGKLNVIGGGEPEKGDVCDGGRLCTVRIWFPDNGPCYINNTAAVSINIINGSY